MERDFYFIGLNILKIVVCLICFICLIFAFASHITEYIDYEYYYFTYYEVKYMDKVDLDNCSFINNLNVTEIEENWNNSEKIIMKSTDLGVRYFSYGDVNFENLCKPTYKFTCNRNESLCVSIEGDICNVLRR